MDAEDARPAQQRDHVGGDRSGEAILVVGACEPAEKRFARGSDQDALAERDDLIETVEQRQVVLDRLAEADPRVDVLQFMPMLC